jgi:hypothetical protein
MQVERFNALLKQRFGHNIQFQLPTIPVDQIFACGFYYTIANSGYIFDLRHDGTLTFTFELDNYQTVTGNGFYTARPRIGLTDFNAHAYYNVPGLGNYDEYKKNNHNTPAYQHRILVTETT